MSVSEQTKTPPRGRGEAAALIAILSIAGLALVWFDLSRRDPTETVADLHAAVSAQTDRIQSLEDAIQALRIEQKSEKKGVYGVLEQIERWSEILCSSTYTDAHHQEARNSMDESLRALRHYGADAFPAIEQALVDSPSQAEEIGACVDEYRRWLLEAARLTDEKAAKRLLVGYLRGHDPRLQPTPRIRWLAADQLIEVDPALAGIELRGILIEESARGSNPATSAGVSVGRSMSGFSNFVGKYVLTDDPELETTLIQVLGKAEHDMITKQEAIKVLGARKSEGAVKFIQRLYDKPPGISGNAIFKNHCIDAVAEIQNTNACGWLQKKYSEEANELVANKLRDWITRLGCK